MDNHLPNRSAGSRWHWLPLASVLLLALAPGHWNRRAASLARRSPPGG